MKRVFKALLTELLFTVLPIVVGHILSNWQTKQLKASQRTIDV